MDRGNTIRLHVSIDASNILYTTATKTPSSLTIPLWGAWNYRLRQIKETEGQSYIFLLKGSNYEAVYYAGFRRLLSDRGEVEKLIKQKKSPKEKANEAFANIEITDGTINISATKLKELDYSRALQLFSSWLPKDQPKHLRLLALRSLGACAFFEAIPEIENIIYDDTEEPAIRTCAMNTGLRYMRVPRTISIARDFIDHQDVGMRVGAYKSYARSYFLAHPIVYRNGLLSDKYRKQVAGKTRSSRYSH